ncbi:hypothetical protein V7S43_006675 [Phytophthora oleae]|uniref:Uncharacterized protein n=1 Tax=Phytophthora oleae TaxID=2107226 RepID=A0ABD3FPD8_9STRA
MRPGSAAYRDWKVLILENTPSPETKKCLTFEADLKALISQPSCVDYPVYPWPTKILQRPRFDNARVQVVKSPPAPRVKRVRFALDVSTQTEDLPCNDVMVMKDAGVDTRDLSVLSESPPPEDSDDTPHVSEDVLPDSECKL